MKRVFYGISFILIVLALVIVLGCGMSWYGWWEETEFLKADQTLEALIYAYFVTGILFLAELFIMYSIIIIFFIYLYRQPQHNNSTPGTLFCWWPFHLVSLVGSLILVFIAAPGIGLVTVNYIHLEGCTQLCSFPCTLLGTIVLLCMSTVTGIFLCLFHFLIQIVG